MPLDTAELIFEVIPVLLSKTVIPPPSVPMYMFLFASAAIELTTS